MINEKTLQAKKKNLEAEFEVMKKKGAVIEKALKEGQKSYAAILGKMADIKSQWKLIDELLKPTKK